VGENGSSLTMKYVSHLGRSLSVFVRSRLSSVFHRSSSVCAVFMMDKLASFRKDVCDIRQEGEMDVICTC